MKFPGFAVINSLICTALLSSCGLVRNVKIPFISSGDKTTTTNDPLLPFDVRKPLVQGHTLEVSVYKGLRSPSRIYHGYAVIDAQGFVHLGSIGDVRVKNMTATQALRAIESAVRHQRPGAIISVHLDRVENTPLITVTGAVRNPGVIQFFDHATPSAVLPYVGGRTGRAGSAIYITHRGERTYHGSGTDAVLEPGDIVEFSADL